LADTTQVKDILTKLEQSLKDLFNSDTYTGFLKTMANFHTYSARNIQLIHSQKPNASHVAGFRS
jgi:uncharacterized protein YpuA (DUF1002 family)